MLQFDKHIIFFKRPWEKNPAFNGLERPEYEAATELHALAGGEENGGCLFFFGEGV